MSRTHAHLLLLLAAALWGFGNVAQKTVLDHLDPLSAVGLRCLIAAVVILPLARAERGEAPRAGSRTSLLRVTACFAAAMTAQQLAYLGTSVTSASFLVNTATVMTPLAAWLLLRERPSPVVMLAAVLTLAGAMLMAGGVAQVSGGDRAALLSAACYAVWMVELGRHVRAHGRPCTAAAVQFAATAALLLPVAAAGGGLSLAAVRAAAVELAVLGVLSTAGAFGLQTVAQRYTPASHAAVVVSAESVFGATAAGLLLGERLTVPAAAGAVLILAAIVVVARAGSAAGTAKARTRVRAFLSAVGVGRAIRR